MFLQHFHRPLFWFFKLNLFKIRKIFHLCWHPVSKLTIFTLYRSNFGHPVRFKSNDHVSSNFLSLLPLILKLNMFNLRKIFHLFWHTVSKSSIFTMYRLNFGHLVLFKSYDHISSNLSSPLILIFQLNFVKLKKVLYIFWHPVSKLSIFTMYTSYVWHLVLFKSNDHVSTNFSSLFCLIILNSICSI